MYFISVLKWASGAHILIAAQRMGSQLLSCNSSIIFGMGMYLCFLVLLGVWFFVTGQTWVGSGKLKMLLGLLQSQADQFQYFKVVYICCHYSATWPCKQSLLGAPCFRLGGWNCLPKLENHEDFKPLLTKGVFQYLLCLIWQFVRHPHRS